MVIDRSRADLKLFFSKFACWQFNFTAQFIEVVAEIQQQNIRFINVIGRGVKIAAVSGFSN